MSLEFPSFALEDVASILRYINDSIPFTKATQKCNKGVTVNQISVSRDRKEAMQATQKMQGMVKVGMTRGSGRF